MKKSLLAGLAVFAFATGSANAADIAPAYKAAPVYTPPCAQFGGFYVGAYGGAAYYNHTWNDRDRWTVEADADLGTSNVRTQKSGFIGGVQGGYNWQGNCTVFGVQADYGWSRITADAFESDGGVGAALDSLTVSSQLRGIGTVRARTGLVVNSLLLYVTGGLAWGSFDRTATQTNDVGGVRIAETFQSSKTKWGAVLGVGTEWSIWNNWSLQSEVLYVFFQRDDNNFLCASVATCGAPGELKRFQYHDDAWIAKIGLNYRFGGRLF